MTIDSQVSSATGATPGILARFFNEFRLASYVLVLYTFGHTLGAVINTPRFGAESDSVVAAMKSVHVQAQGADCTWYGFYRGFGIIVSVYFILSAVLTWQLGGMTPAERRKFKLVTWTLFLGFVVCAIVTWSSFFPVPLVFSVALAVLLGFACMRTRATGDRKTSVAGA
jgi:hypothetical protein